MTQSSGSDLHDRQWRIWASVAVSATVLSGILLGVLIIPVVQGRSEGIDAYTAICRALGILPGSPARQQVSDRTPPTPVSQVVWTPGLLQILAEAKPERGKAKVQEVCIACHGEQGVSVSPEYPNLAGQSGAAIYKQLSDYRTGSRTNQLMTDIAKAWTRRRSLMSPPTTRRSRSAIRTRRRSRNPLPPSSTWSSSAIPAAISRLVRRATGRVGRPDRSPVSLRARARLPRLAAEDVCRGRSSQ